MSFFRLHAKKILTVIVSVSLLGFILGKVDLADIVARYADLPLYVLLLLLVLITSNLLFSSVRLFVQIRTAGFSIPFAIAFKANTAGLVSSLVVVNLLGAMAGRFYTLRHYGVHPVTIAAITAIERILLVLVAGSLFVAGSVMLFGFNEFTALLRQTNLPSIIGVVAFIVIVLVFFLKEPKERALLAGILRRPVLRSGTVLFALTLLSQILMLGVYLVASKGVGVTVSSISILAAAAVISFAASMPISVNGWGVREIASIYALGQLGVDPATAVSISVLVGLSSTAVVVLTGVILLPDALKTRTASAVDPKAATESGSEPPAQADSTHVKMSWIGLTAGSLTTILIFFQVHTEFGNTLLNVNLADPMAVLGILAAALVLVQSRSAINAVPRPLVYWLLGLTALIVLGFLHGVYRFGVTEWALTNRLVGWAVLLGYFCIGASYTRQFGEDGLKRVIQIMIVTAATIVVFSTIEKATLLMIGTKSDVPTNMEGFSFNRNAFCFQLLIALSGALVFSRSIAETAASRVWCVLVATILFGIWATQSRTGLSIATVLVSAGLIFRQFDRRFIVSCLLASLGIGLIAAYGPTILYALLDDAGQSLKFHPVTVYHFSESGLMERWTSIIEGIRIWRDHMFFGGGLGAFVNKGIQSAGGGILVIHSVPVWILAEFGIVGAVIVITAPSLHLYRVFKSGIGALPLSHLFFASTAGVMVVYGLIHDMAYQRTFWFVLGAAAAAIAIRKEQYTQD
ncbi:MAG: lysylphosphatidylglycerol synthase domain-containing protein [Alphaproteobacteria bacterium]